MLRWDEPEPVSRSFWRGLLNGSLLSLVIWGLIFVLVYTGWHV